MQNMLFDYNNKDDRFWQLIAKAAQSQEKFYQLIYSFSYEELRNYQETFFTLDVWTEEHLKVLKENSCFQHFPILINNRLYSIEKGYEYFMEVKNNPQKTPTHIRSYDYDELLYYVIEKVIQEKYQQRFFKPLDPENRFWTYINKAQANQKIFYELIYPLSLDELREYKRVFYQKGLFVPETHEVTSEILKDTDSDLWSIMTFYIISQGYNYYREVVLNPRKYLPMEVKMDNPHILYGVIEEVIQEKYPHEYFDYKNPNSIFWKYIDKANQDEYKFSKIISSLSLEGLRTYQMQVKEAGEYLANNTSLEYLRDGEDMFAMPEHIVSLGYECYIDILQNPENMLKLEVHRGSDYFSDIFYPIMWSKYRVE